ncbi:MAG: uroporphyrinogen-III C-methyltransferase [Phycisphaerales bacterium]
MRKYGKVYIVGAGPGCGGLISVRGLAVLKQADCVLYDKLIGKDLPAYISPDAEMIYVGKDQTKQQFINDIIVKKAKKHKIIVRLKGGDPTIFGRATEEFNMLLEENIDFEIIPGITAASAAAASAGISLTDRNTASSVTFVTGQTLDGKMIKIDFKSLVRLGGTIVFYMAVAKMKQICQKLIQAGLDGNTNAIVIANATLANQKIIFASLSDIAGECERQGIEPPAVLIVGKKCRSMLRDKPLFGKKILITRDSAGNAEFACKLAASGACAIECPTFEIQDLTGRREFLNVIDKIKNFDWVFFTSPTGVRLFFKAIHKLKKDGRVFSDSKIGCIGSETASTLEEHGMIADFVPDEFTTKSLAKEFAAKYKPKGKNILFLRSGLAEEFEIAGAKVQTVAVYTARKVRTEKTDFSATSRQVGTSVEMTNMDWITFASSFAVKCFFEKFNADDLKDIKIASIGPVTSETLKKFGVEPSVEAKEHTIDGLIREIERNINHE